MKKNGPKLKSVTTLALVFFSFLNSFVSETFLLRKAILIVVLGDAK